LISMESSGRNAKIVIPFSDVLNVAYFQGEILPPPPPSSASPVVVHSAFADPATSAAKGVLVVNYQDAETKLIDIALLPCFGNEGNYNEVSDIWKAESSFQRNGVSKFPKSDSGYLSVNGDAELIWSGMGLDHSKHLGKLSAAA
jgi:hypothetical protein